MPLSVEPFIQPEINGKGINAVNNINAIIEEISRIPSTNEPSWVDQPDVRRLSAHTGNGYQPSYGAAVGATVSAYAQDITENIPGYEELTSGERHQIRVSVECAIYGSFGPDMLRTEAQQYSRDDVADAMSRFLLPTATAVRLAIFSALKG
jgi:hypothetical protein